jgi:hypothetical protein
MGEAFMADNCQRAVLPPAILHLGHAGLGAQGDQSYEPGWRMVGPGFADFFDHPLAGG